eukprot:gnl/Trimastix_PCT/2905.p1 GENE.gnl/Trimastix_PCT/2905~~gnl/Trimastix_PCT/2905.p1  ORF type:complete len:196 (+),score=32.79 gnl/Trimastix_PCT/2905:16-603(+)
MNKEMSQQFQFKVVLVGASSVGKSSLILRFVNNEFLDYIESTIGGVFVSRSIQLEECTVKLDIWDTAGQERYDSIVPMFYRGAPAGIIVYDITNYDSFTRAKDWVKRLQRECAPNAILALTGNKFDMAANRRVSTEEGQTYAENTGCLFFETSAKIDHNVTELFVDIARHLPKESAPEKETVPLGPPQPSNRCKC